MGVFSFARYDDSFYTRGYPGRLQKSLKPKPGDYSVFDGYYTPPITSTLLLRSCKVSIMFLHAINFEWSAFFYFLSPADKKNTAVGGLSLIRNT